MPTSTSTTTVTTETCPYCSTTDGTRKTSDTGRIQAWACDHCGTDWAFTVADSRAVTLPADLGAAVREIGRLRWSLTQVIALADDAPELVDVELRTRLLALADLVRPDTSPG